MGESQKPGAPGGDVRALFSKANIGSNRYVTFAAPKVADFSPGITPVARTEEDAVAAAPALPAHPRRTLNSVVEVNSRLRIASLRPRAVLGSSEALAFASCTGGAGKTTLCATVARVLAGQSTNVLVADRCRDGLIPLFFGLERQAAGGLQTVYPNARRAGYPVTLVAVPCDEDPNPSTAAWLQQLQAESRLTLLDFPTFTGRTVDAVLESCGQILVPLLPDVQSLANLGRAEELMGTANGGLIHFVLNRFDAGRPLHREIRAHLENLLGERLCPLAIRESELITEGLSLGMTVLDHAPQSPVAKDMEQLVDWLKQRLAGTEAAASKVETIA